MKYFGCFITLLFLLSAMPAQASDLVLFGGFQHPGSLTLRQSPDSITPLFTDPRDFGFFGVRFSGGGVIGGEQTLAYSPNFIESETKAVILHSNFRVQAPLPKVKPYGTIGLSTVFTHGNGIADLGRKFGLNYGGGVNIIMAGPVGIAFDVRGYAIPSYQ